MSEDLTGSLSLLKQILEEGSLLTRHMVHQILFLCCHKQRPDLGRAVYLSFVKKCNGKPSQRTFRPFFLQLSWDSRVPWLAWAVKEAREQGIDTRSLPLVDSLRGLLGPAAGLPHAVERALPRALDFIEAHPDTKKLEGLAEVLTSVAKEHSIPLTELSGPGLEEKQRRRRRHKKEAASAAAATVEAAAEAADEEAAKEAAVEGAAERAAAEIAKAAALERAAELERAEFERTEAENTPHKE